MKKYSKYKESGIEWIGLIPDGWDVVKTKYIANLYTGNSLNDAQKEEYSSPCSPFMLPYIATKDICSESDIINYDNGIYIPQSNTGFKIAPANSFLLCIEGGSAGRKMAFLDKDVCFVNKLCCFKSSLNSKYHYYFIQSAEFNYVFQQNIQGLIGGVSVSVLSNLPILVPSVSEQNKIVEYLDTKIKSIDKLIAEKNALIGDLNNYKLSIITEAVTKGVRGNAQFKITGIEWIGKIPQSWEVKQFKRCLSEGLMYGANESAESDDLNFPRYIRITDIDDNNQLRDNTFKSLPHDKAKDYMLSPGDILFARSGATVGKTYLYPGGFDACFAGYLIRARLNSSMLPEYAMYYTLSSCYENWKNSVYIQATIQNIGADKYSTMPITVPSIDEQKEIVSYLNERTTQIMRVIAELEKQVEDLTKYRIAIISEAVTGKIDLRNWNPEK